MMQLRPARARGLVTTSWLSSRHSFSFGEYDDPDWRGFRSLRVINDDVIAPGAGFPMHPHRDMEILTLVLSGILEHRDSTGGQGRIVPGEIQHMRAGTGIRHSEYNASQTDPLHLLQIWLLPDRNGLPPGYSQQEFSLSQNGAQCLASGRGRAGALALALDADVWRVCLGPGQRFRLPLELHRHGWLQMIRGEAELTDCSLQAGDGLAFSEENAPELLAGTQGMDALLFDLA